MSVVSAPSALTVTMTERTWRATVETPFVDAPGSYSLTIHREQRSADQNGNPVGDAVVLPPIPLLFSAIGDDTITVAGTTMTVTQVAGFLQAYFDQEATALEAAAAQSSSSSAS